MYILNVVVVMSLLLYPIAPFFLRFVCYVKSVLTTRTNMDNNNRLSELIKDWEKLLVTFKIKMDKLISENATPSKIVQRRGMPVVVDPIMDKAILIQQAIIELLPESEKIINGSPTYLNGEWHIDDYVDLIIGHNELIILKIKETINKSNKK